MEFERSAIKQEPNDLKYIIRKIQQYWKLILLSTFIAMSIAVVVSRYSQTVYRISASILIKKEKPLIDLQNADPIEAVENKFSIVNETEMLKSTHITERALKRLNFGISYFQKIPFARRELYLNSPFEIIPDSLALQTTDVLYKVKFLSDSTYFLSADFQNAQLRNLYTQSVKNVIYNCKFKNTFICNKPVKTDLISFTLRLKNPKKSNTNIIGKEYYFSLRSWESLIREFRNYEVTDLRNSTILQVSFKGNNIDKIVDFLNCICNIYLEKSIEKKHISAANTINFISNQLLEVSDSLKLSQERLQTFQSANKIMDVDFYSQEVFKGLEDLQNRKAELLARQKYFEYLKDLLEKNSDVKTFIAPASMGIDDPVLNSLFSEFTDMINDRAELANNLKKENPFTTSYDAKVSNLKKVIFNNVKNLIDANEMSVHYIDQRIDKVSAEEEKLPKTQKELFGYERIFKLYSDLYTYLLSKRSDLQISKAGLISDNEIVNEADKRDAILISPNFMKNMLIAIMLGLCIPFVLIFFNDYFNEKIREIEDVESIADFPVLGHAIHNKSKNLIPIFDDPKSIVAESFRSIRTNFQFVAPLNEKHVILVTSSMMDEGKSYTSINLAASFALFGKKTLLLYFDLRKPMRNVPFDLTNNKGISTFLSGNDELEKIINTTSNKNLNVILPGPVPPNPNELIASPVTNEMIFNLKQWFDYIIIDTPPVGMVADAMLLFNFSDVNIFMVRHNYTRKAIFKQIVSTLKKRNIQNVNIIINDLPVAQSGYGYGYNYGYNYNYGYGYGYYNKEKPAFMDKIFRHKLYKKQKEPIN